MFNIQWTKCRKIFAALCAISITSLLLTGCKATKTNHSNIVKHDGAAFAPLEYPENIFYYDYNGNSQDNFEEVDGIYPVESPRWKMIWNGGDLYCENVVVSEANNYYADDDNYDWYVQIDTEDDTEITPHPIKVTDVDLDEVYELETMKRELAVFFDEFESLGSIVKISKDGVVQGTLSIAKYNGKWYWKTEIIDDSKEQDGTWPEYIHPLPASLNKIIQAVE